VEIWLTAKVGSQEPRENLLRRRDDLQRLRRRLRAERVERAGDALGRCGSDLVAGNQGHRGHLGDRDRRAAVKFR
jgi:hypothetical protein